MKAKPKASYYALPYIACTKQISHRLQKAIEMVLPTSYNKSCDFLSFSLISYNLEESKKYINTQKWQYLLPSENDISITKSF